MRFFKITLRIIGGSYEKTFYMLPLDEVCEDGTPVYDEELIPTTPEFKSFVSETKSAVVEVEYALCETREEKISSYDQLLHLEQKGGIVILDKNDYLVETKKVKKKKSGGGKKSLNGMYIIVAVIIALVVVMLLVSPSKPTSELESETTATDNTEPTGDTSSLESSITAQAEITTTQEESTAAAANAAPLISITFDKNGGVGALSEMQAEAGKVVDLPFTNVSRVGYSLSGWATAAAQPYTLYDNDNNRLVMPSETITLYAIWGASEYDVIYNYQLNDRAVSSKERVKFGENIEFLDISNLPANGTFVGWALTPDATEPLISCTMPDGGIELFAIYE